MMMTLTRSILTRSNQRAMSVFSQVKADQYEQFTLNDGSVAETPGAQFRTWFEEAVSKSISFPEAMNIATCELPSGRVSNRIVLMKDFDSADRVVFYSNWETSRKGQDFGTNPWFAATFFWKELERQVRVEGKGEFMSNEEAQPYFDTRPRASRIGAWASPQSKELESRESFDDMVKETEQKFEGQDQIPCPPHWGGVRITPVHWEFWQGRHGRLHDRIVYDKEGDDWKVKRIAP